MIEIIFTVLIILLDQISKILCASWLTTLPMHTYSVIDGVFSLTYIENTGASFGILAGGRIFFLIVTAAACAVMIWFLIKEHKNLHTLMRVSVAMILAGALGNFIDRAVLGYVRDMIQPTFIDFAVFNIADSAVCVGAALLAIDVLFLKKGKKYMEKFEKKKGVEPSRDDEGGE